MSADKMPLPLRRARTCEGYTENIGTYGHPGHPDEADERDAIVNEDRYSTQQTIPQATMVAGLIRAARWNSRGTDQ